MPHCWKSHVTAHNYIILPLFFFMSLVLFSLSGQPISLETKFAANTRGVSCLFEQI